MWAKRLISGLFAVLLAGSVQAQSPFSAAVTVNGGIVTWYDIDQRARMLEVIGQASDSEKAAREAGFNETVFSAVVRAAGHPARPEGYQPLDGFWRNRGYERISGLTTGFSWKDIGEAGETEKLMEYWHKMLI